MPLTPHPIEYGSLSTFHASAGCSSVPQFKSHESSATSKSGWSTSVDRTESSFSDASGETMLLLVHENRWFSCLLVLT